MTDILCGWKEIAKHLEVCEKTARIYHKERGLPVFKDPAGHPLIDKKDADGWRLKELAPIS